MDGRCIGRLTLELDFKLPLLDLEHGVNRADASAAQVG
jgi:hypothetical protein